ncbi:MAG: hypothetical protein IJP16_03150 [Clostridia bacterium]|nr:hypothetical protein [Clostridia bacterium]
MTLAEKNIQKGWDFIFDKLYYPKTHMIYDFLYKDSIEESVDFYPNAEEIKNSFPNPCGWGTGMEDSTLNLCTMLETIENRYKATEDEEMKKYFDMMLEGLMITGTVSGSPGFIARCVSPCDGKSVYMDTSRDQYTHWVFAGHIIHNSKLARDEQKKSSAKIIVDIAKKMEREVTRENGGYSLRLDGGRGRVCQMISSAEAPLGPHEILRFPMFYLAAYEVSEDEHWLNKYRELREELLTETEKGFTVEWIEKIEKSFGYVYGTYQAQYSFRLLYDIETDEKYKERYLRLMQIAAEGSRCYLDTAHKNIGIYNFEQPYYRPWRDIKKVSYGNIDGYEYYVPNSTDGDDYIKEIELVRKNLRNTGEAVIIHNLCPNVTLNDEDTKKLTEIIESSNFNNIKSYWPIVLCGAWWGLLADKK